MMSLWRNDDEMHSSSFFAIYLQQIIKLIVFMTNESNFGKVTHDNLPQAVEHLIKLMEVQVENQNKEIPIEKDEMNIEEVSSLIKKSISTVYRYTCQQCIPHTKIGNTLHFYRSEILEWMKLHKKKSIQDLYDETSIESFKVLNRD